MGDNKQQQRQIDAYLAEYNASLQQLLLLSSASSSTDNDKNGEKQRQLKECRDCLQLMRMEARALPGGDGDHDYSKMEWMERIKSFQRQLGAYQKEVDDRDELLGSGSTTSQHAHKNDNEDDAMLVRQNATLDRARQTLQETEATAMGVCNELHENRSKIKSVQSQINEVSSLADRAGHLIESISKKRNSWW